MTMTLIERFEKKFSRLREDDCWPWVASTDMCGYGKFRILNRMVGAHRVSYEIYCGEIPEGLHVLHKCDNRRCVNPSHFSLGTHKENMKDRDAKGRNNVPFGSKSGKAKLNETDVLEIRNAIDYRGVCVDLSRKFNVTSVLISQIRRGKGWSHVKPSTVVASAG